MKLKFDPRQQFQIDAIDSVVHLFEGQQANAGNFVFKLSGQQQILGSDLAAETGAIGNQLVLEEQAILENLKKIQDKNGLIPSESLDGMHFSVEMETGTGKTYVYLRTIFELAKNYNFTKFVILVPSVAIKEGVDSSIRIMREHFDELYSAPFDSQVYSGKSPESVHQFATSTNIQIMIMTIDSIKGDKNNRIIHQKRDKLNGIRPIDYLSSTQPIVIMDEPQNMEGELSKTAIKELNPLCTLRYSATHKKYHNLLYQLDPVQAHEQGLVKTIEVAEVTQQGGDAMPYIKLLEVKREPFRVKLELAVATTSGVQRRPIILKQGEDLERATKNELYAGNWRINAISIDPEEIELTNHGIMKVGESIGDNNDAIYREMIRETVKQHLKKLHMLCESGIKVLSLFFIDRVSNYIDYDENGVKITGKFGLWFEEILEEEKNKDEQYKGLFTQSAHELHSGYFSVTKKGGKELAVDSSEAGNQRDDEAYELIMKAKERLLDINEPLQFIFSHSALREGWDNPNVFQICVLREMGATLERRQTIGRGLRLPVNQDGERIMGEGIQKLLTVVANESYRQFADTLQKEYKDAGVDFGHVRKNAFSKIPDKLEPDSGKTINYDNSEKIWKHLKDTGMIDEDGKVLPSFAPENLGFTINLPSEFKSYASEVIEVVRNSRIERIVKPVSQRQTVKFNKQVFLSPDFLDLWGKISARTTYKVAIDRDSLVTQAVAKIKKMPEVRPLRVEITRTGVRMLRGGMKGEELSSRSANIKGHFTLPDIVKELQEATSLTRQTIVEILQKSGRLHEFVNNPADFIYAIRIQLSEVLSGLVIDGIKYEKIAGSLYELRRLEEDGEKEKIRFMDNLYKVKHAKKTVYDYVEYDSDVEHQFAEKLDSREDIRLFMKLPREFKIPTPVGEYNPDWAIVKQEDGEEKIYMIRETKGTQSDMDLRETEKTKIECGRQHFAAIGVDNYSKASPENWNI